MRYPDKPGSTMALEAVADLKPHLYLCELKMDGWRTVIDVRRPLSTFTSRHNKPIPITGPMAARVQEIIERCGIPDGTILDAEWIARRPACREEALVIFDMMQFGNNPMWGWTVERRFSELMRQFKAYPSLIVPVTTDDYPAFIAEHRDRPDAEGVVLKRVGSPYIGSVRASADNPAWIRAKWRAGESGISPL